VTCRSKNIAYFKNTVIYSLTFYFLCYSFSEQKSACLRAHGHLREHHKTKKILNSPSLLLHNFFPLQLLWAPHVSVFSLSLKRYAIHLRYSLSLVSLSIYLPTNILPCGILRPGEKLYQCSGLPKADVASFTLLCLRQHSSRGIHHHLGKMGQ